MERNSFSENEVKHLEMIEAIIERMGQNSFALKGWAMTLIVAIYAFSATGSEKKFVLVAIAPIIAFWFLDSFYLLKERKYRELYKKVMAHEVEPFSMNTAKVTGRRIGFFKCLFSFTESLFYFVCIATTIAVFIWLFRGKTP